MSSQTDKQPAKRRVHHFRQMKSKGEKIAVVTAYDYPTALAADTAGADAILVGDSLANVALGLDSTIPVTLDIMVHHTAAVRRGAKKSFVIADMPFLTYGVTRAESLKNAGRLIQEAGAEAVKIEGGVPMMDTITAMVDVGIPVLAHIGLTPQSVNALGGYRVQGRDEDSANQLMEDARAVQKAGAFGVVLEAVPSDLAQKISQELTIPTIGIGAGAHCDGQVLVISDIVGMLPGRVPKFVKQYSDLGSEMTRAIKEFSDEVRAGTFPASEHQY